MKRGTEERFDSRYLLLSCGDGVSLELELECKLKLVRELYADCLADFEFYSIVELTSIYGVDDSSLMVRSCRKRLYDCFVKQYAKVTDDAIPAPIVKGINFILSKNIICADVEGFAIVDNDNQQPIELSIWSYENQKIKRTDYLLSELLERTYAIDINLFRGYDGEITLTAPQRKHHPRSIQH